MDTKKTLFGILGSVALTTVIGILVRSYKVSFRRKNIVEKASDDTEAAIESIAESAANLKNRLKEMGEDSVRMINEGGNAQKMVKEK